MKIIQGFVTKDEYITNAPGQISPIFEISPQSLTYSRHRGEYQHHSYVGDILHTFMSVDSVTGVKFSLTPSHVGEIFAVISSIMEYVASRTPPYSTVDFLNFVRAENQEEIRDLAFGDYVDHFPSIPEWVSWESVTHPGSQVRVWLSDQSFQFYYPSFENIVVPPVDNIDRFFGNYSDMAGEILQTTIQQVMERAQSARGDHPPTYTRVYEFNYTNPFNLNQKTKTVWSVLIYGREGDNIDHIKDSIIEYIEQNSSRSREEWEVIFPEIFQRTEFLIWPRWDLTSIPNLSSNASLYSSVLDPMECIAFANERWTNYPIGYVDSHLSTIPFDYKAISAVILAGDSNIEGKKVFSNLYPDYIPVPNTSHDFGRMKPKTQEWIMAMLELLVEAEKATLYSPLPGKIRRITRNGTIYISHLFDGVNYLMAIKANQI